MDKLSSRLDIKETVMSKTEEKPFAIIKMKYRAKID